MDQFSAMAEQRRMARYPLELTGVLSFPDPERAAVRVVTRNICAGGALIRTGSFCPPCTRVNLEVVLSRRDPGDPSRGRRETRVALAGQVVRASGEELAICFDRRFEMAPV